MTISSFDYNLYVDTGYQNHSCITVVVIEQYFSNVTLHFQYFFHHCI